MHNKGTTITTVKIYEQHVEVENRKENINNKLEEILSQYVCGDKKENIKMKIQKILENEFNYLCFWILNSQYYLCEKPDHLELKLKDLDDISIDIKNIIRINFYDIPIPEVDDLLTALLNECLFGISLEVPVRLKYIHIQDKKQEGIIKIFDTWYPCTLTYNDEWLITQVIPSKLIDNWQHSHCKYRVRSMVYNFDIENLKAFKFSPFSNVYAPYPIDSLYDYDGNTIKEHPFSKDIKSYYRIVYISKKLDK